MFVLFGANSSEDVCILAEPLVLSWRLMDLFGCHVMILCIWLIKFDCNVNIVILLYM